MVRPPGGKLGAAAVVVADLDVKARRCWTDPVEEACTSRRKLCLLFHGLVTNSSVQSLPLITSCSSTGITRSLGVRLGLFALSLLLGLTHQGHAEQSESKPRKGLTSSASPLDPHVFNPWLTSSGAS